MVKDSADVRVLAFIRQALGGSFELPYCSVQSDAVGSELDICGNKPSRVPAATLEALQTYTVCQK